MAELVVIPRRPSLFAQVHTYALSPFSTLDALDMRLWRLVRKLTVPLNKPATVRPCPIATTVTCDLR